jgi:hypothetical protein
MYVMNGSCGEKKKKKRQKMWEREKKRECVRRNTGKKT